MRVGALKLPGVDLLRQPHFSFHPPVFSVACQSIRREGLVIKFSHWVLAPKRISALILIGGL
jgi:hypothetical protein